MTKVEMINKIEKSSKKEGYAFVGLKNGKYYLRKVYTDRWGINRPSLNLDTDVFSFDWDGDKAINIKYELNYKEKEQVGIADSIKDEIKNKNITVQKPALVVDTDKEIKHERFEAIKTCIENKIPVYLVGPAGSGKNHTLEQIAKELDLEFYFTNSVQQEYKLTGFIDAGGEYHETEFYKAFTNGGLFFLDEMDASIPEVLVLLNAAIANGYFEFPNGKVTAHKKFRVVAAGNTVGDGADEQYTGRLVLDQATLDRFAIIEFDYDMKVELHISKNNSELVTFIRDLRKQAKEKGIRATFSYRCISMVTKLEGKMQVEEILKIAVFKGMDKDTINTFNSWNTNKYNQALKKVQGM